MKDGVVIAFDCMETIVDMTELPDQDGYARWTFEDSGVESYWDSFDEFNRDYNNSRSNHNISENGLLEQTKKDRIMEVVKANKRITNSHEEIVDKLFDNFWSKYLSRCYASDEVVSTLKKFKEHGYRLVVISNFTVPYGVHEILEKCGLMEYFENVYSSADIGYRKPHSMIFKKIIDDFKIQPHNVILLGDDLDADYYGGLSYGFRTCLYDPNDNHRQIKNRVVRFSEYYSFVANFNY